MEASRRKTPVDQVLTVQSRRTTLASVTIGVFMTIGIGTVTFLIIGFVCVDPQLCFVNNDNIGTDNRGGVGKALRSKQENDNKPTRTFMKTLQTVLSSPPTTSPWRRRRVEADVCWEQHSGVCVKDRCPFEVSSRRRVMCGDESSCCVPKTSPDPISRSSCGHLPPSRARIFNRKTRQWPFVASLQEEGSHVCSATILSPTFVLTAAHCLRNRNLEEISIVTGDRTLDKVSGTEQAANVSEVVMTDDSRLDELALLRVEPEIGMDAWRQPICLPAVDTFSCEEGATDLVLSVGWHANGSNSIQAIAHFLVPAARCSGCQDVCAVPVDENRPVSDSGAPLLGRRGGRYFLAGVTADREQSCFDGGSPEEFCGVSGYLQWIARTVKDLPAED